MKEAFGPANNIADGKMYLRLAADMDNRIAELRDRFNSTGDMQFYYKIQELKKIRREHRDTAALLLRRGELREREKAGKGEHCR